MFWGFGAHQTFGGGETSNRILEYIISTIIYKQLYEWYGFTDETHGYVLPPVIDEV